jgi:hypothetical protein
MLDIPLLKPTDAHFCNYIKSKNRLKLNYTRHVSVRLRPPSAVCTRQHDRLICWHNIDRVYTDVHKELYT